MTDDAMSRTTLPDREMTMFGQHCRVVTDTKWGGTGGVTAVTDPPTNPCSTSNVVSPHTKLSSARAGMIIRAKARCNLPAFFCALYAPYSCNARFLPALKPIPASEYRQFANGRLNLSMVKSSACAADNHMFTPCNLDQPRQEFFTASGGIITAPCWSIWTISFVDTVRP